MSLFAQLTINGLIAGSIYALVASGFSLIYGTNKFMHFAHGVSVVIAGYIMYSFFLLGGKNLIFITFIPAVAITALFGLWIYRLIYAPLQKRKASNVILLTASIAILILFQNLVQAIFGASVKSVNYSSSGSFEIADGVITSLQLTIIIISILLFLGLFVFMKKTKLGRNMRAVFENKELASVVGINQRAVVEYSFFIGSALAGVAGILIGLEQNLTPFIGTNLIIKGFTGAVIGGVTNIPASIAGSYLLGLAENYGIAFLPSGLKDAIAFALLFIFLLFRPHGLFGLNRRLR